MADRSGLKLLGFIFATVTMAVMLTAVNVVSSYADGGYNPAPEITASISE